MLTHFKISATMNAEKAGANSYQDTIYVLLG